MRIRPSELGRTVGKEARRRPAERRLRSLARRVVEGGSRPRGPGPGGIHLLAADGTRLGSILTGFATANLAFAHDGAVYVAAGHGVFRLRRPPRS